jgi:hypothetical protein
MKTLLALVVTLVFSGCLSSGDPETSKPALYTCTTRITTCSPSDSRVCFEWCKTADVCTADVPEVVACSGNDDCAVECAPKEGPCE